MPASLGVHGPGEMTMRSGCSCSISSSVIWSLRRTSSCLPHLAEILREVVGEGIVVVEEQDHVAIPNRAASFFATRLDVGDFQGVDDGAGLVYGLLIFALGDGIGDDAAAGLDVGAPVFGDQGAEARCRSRDCRKNRDTGSRRRKCRGGWARARR